MGAQVGHALLEREEAESILRVRRRPRGVAHHAGDTDGANEQGRRDEAPRVDDEGDPGADSGQEQAAQRRADRQHRAPCRARERVGGEQRAGLDHLRQRGRSRRFEEARQRLLREHQRVDPDHVLRPADEQVPEDDDGPAEIARDHDPAAREAIGDDARQRRPQDRREHPHDEDAGEA